MNKQERLFINRLCIGLEPPRFKKYLKKDGGPGSGNFGHSGVPGQVGGSAPGNGSRAVVNGSDILRSYSGKPDIKSVMEAQGFTGLPKVVSKKEFDEAVKASNFIAQRTYSASSQEILDAYRNQLYNGEWYVECEVGGAQYGQGMYVASDYNGEITEGMQEEMEHYSKLGDKRFGEKLSDEERCEAAVKYLKDWQGDNEHYSEMEEYVRAQFSGDWKRLMEAEKKLTSGEIAFANVSSDEAPMYADAPEYVETMTLDHSARIIDYQDVRSIQDDDGSEISESYRKDFQRKMFNEIAEKEGLNDLERAISRHYLNLHTVGSEEEAEDMRAYRSASEEERARAFKTYRKKVGRQVTDGYKYHVRDLRQMDTGALAALLGYDAINAKGHGASGSYTVILNRTKIIILDGNGHQDAKDDSVIFFQLGSDGVIYAIRAGKVIGWVSAGMSEDKNADSSEKPLDISGQSDTIKSRDQHHDADDVDWITVNGAHIPLKDGTAVGGGALEGQDFSASASTSSSPSLAKAHWPDDFPKVTVHTNLQTLRHANPERHHAAKHGDTQAAKEIIAQCVKMERVEELAKKYPDAKVVPVRGEDSEEGNQIPMTFASCFEAFGLEVEDGIVQTKKAGHTDSDQFHRLMSRPEFDGKVEPGREYILVDDHVTNGGTLSDLRKYIVSNGGKVVAISTLSASQGGTYIAIQKKTVEQIRAKHGEGIDSLLRKGGIAYDVESLTDKEGRYILSMNPDTLKRRIEEDG